MRTLVIAEKPGVARDIAAVLGANERGTGLFRSDTHVVSWAIGHLVALAEPAQVDPRWKSWRMELLPMLPEAWPLVVGEETKAQYEVLRKLLVSREIRDVVCATDAGREGELIFRYIYEAARSKKPVRRLWISSLTPDAIAKGFRSLQDGATFEPLADAARARSRADWLVGMNLSRAYSLLYDDNLSVGRVQTPTLAMLVERELEIRNFVPEDYLELHATFDAAPAAPDGPPRVYDGVYLRPGVKGPEARRLPIDGEEATRLEERAKRGAAHIASVTREVRKVPPPQLYDLTELQRHANRLYGFTAQRTLSVAQSLYERWKILSYPRTDSRHLSSTVAATLPDIVEAIAPAYAGLLPAPIAAGLALPKLGTRFVDDTRVSDHHAILPTQTPAPASLPADERKIYDLVCRRLLSAWHDEHIFAVTTVVTHIVADAVADVYTSSGTSIEQVGWKVLDVGGPRTAANKAQEPTLPGGLQKGMPVKVLKTKATPKKTQPPPHLNDATLLTAMETAGRGLEEKEMSDAMRARGLGTPATRAAILETLLRRGYVLREGKALRATDKGIGLIERVHPHVKSPAMTGEWEAKLGRIERRQGELEPFMEDIAAYVREVVGTIRSSGPAREYPYALPASKLGGQPATKDDARSLPLAPPAVARGAASPAVARGAASPAVARGDAAPAVARGGAAPAVARGAAAPAFARGVGAPASARGDGAPWRSGAKDLASLLRDAFHLAAFRPYQEAVCRSVASGDDVLLVMPTGAGKSLCYQLPGVARGGTTLVVSPLVALMEDQVAKLVELGFAAARIHAGRDRMESREVCKAYLDGALDFLFIAPERLRVRGFPEMLARRKPSLIAIDEAHCISQWGHDFRPDYRMLGERLPLLMPTPIVALTATATPAVQDDIAAQLRLANPQRFIHGFRRTNIAVEVLERNPSERTPLVREILTPPGRRPAIVYAPTRKDAEALAKALSPRIRAAAYHAGLSPEVRDRVQTAFINGKYDVVVATTAFGMGIDKADVRTVVHTALPATLEGYYQEIGRAGRDGDPSRAVLLYGFSDTKTHEFFLERDYPPEAQLAQVERALAKGPLHLAELARKSKVKSEVLEKVLEKLSVHAGVRVDQEGLVHPGDGSLDFREAYARQRAHKVDQLEKMRRYAESSTCRMLGLVRHFGDQHDSGQPCGICDVCDPAACEAQTFRTPTRDDRASLEKILESLNARANAPTVGQLQIELGIDRHELGLLLAALARASVVELREESFEKDGKTIHYQRVRLTDAEVHMETLRIEDRPEPPPEPARKWRGRKGFRRAKSTTKKRATKGAPRAKRTKRS